MSWNEEIQGITIGTLFKFYGKNLVAGILWVFLLYAIIMIPIVAIMGVMAAFFGESIF
ncbi:hypothetical protein ACFLV2_00915 [Chloroflexota bacterium]